MVRRNMVKRTLGCIMALTMAVSGITVGARVGNNGDTVACAEECKTIEEINIPDTVTEICSSAFSESALEITFKGTYQQSLARSMTAMINSFRTGSEAWVWNSSDTEKVYYSGLGTLTYDYELEKIAMKRAAELVALYGHTRPNGSDCFTAYTGTYTNTYIGENIAIGTSNLDATRAFELWREDDESYSGQGHRRSMLNSLYTAVGIAHVYYRGCHYWVQEFSSKIGSNVYTEPCDGQTDMTVSVATSIIQSDTLRSEYNSIDVSIDESVEFPKVYNTIKTSTWAYAPALEYEVSPQWSVTSGSSVLRISGNSYIGNAEGNATLTGTYNNKAININVRVKPSWKKEGNNWYYYDKNGLKVTGWKKINSKWYYFNTSGVMQTSKWISNLYYVKSDGVMAVSEIVQGKYYVDSKGKWVKATKWLQVNGNWYYMVSGTIQVSKWVKVGTKWYYFDDSGVMQTSKWISGKYYVKADGSMATSEFADGGKYYVDKDGIWVKATKWLQVNGNWYYMVSGTIQVSKWVKVGTKWYYFDDSGVMQKSKWISGKYYVKADGSMAVSEWVDGGKYYVGADGKWVRNP